MGVFQDIQSYLSNHFSKNGEAVSQDVSEEDEYLAYFEAQKARGYPEILSLDEIQGDTMTSSLKLSNLMRDPETSEGTIEVALGRLKDMKNENVVPAIIGVVKEKPAFLDFGVDALRNGISATPKSFIQDVSLLFHNMPNHFDDVFKCLEEQNDVSAVKAVAVIALNYPEHSDLAIQTLEKMSPAEHDKYRSAEGVHTLDGLTMDEIKETIREHTSLTTQMRGVLMNAGISSAHSTMDQPDIGKGADDLTL